MIYFQQTLLQVLYTVSRQNVNGPKVSPWGNHGKYNKIKNKYIWKVYNITEQNSISLINNLKFLHTILNRDQHRVKIELHNLTVDKHCKLVTEQ